MDQLSIYSNSYNKPLAYTKRPTRLEDFVGQDEAIKIIKKIIEKKDIPNMIIYGPPGCGKSTIARIIANLVDYEFVYLNAIKSSVVDIKQIVQNAKNNLNFSGRRTLLLFDEIHRFNKAQQDVFLEDLESGDITLIATTTENPFYRLNKAISSRSVIIKFEKLTKENIELIVKNACKNVESDELDFIKQNSNGDARQALNLLDLILKTDLDTVKNGIDIQNTYDDNDKYHRISAMIKSIRGSDADASVYWLASMLNDGQDPLYIARRLCISASEDIGLANPQAMVIANSAYQMAKEIGMPEIRIILSECAIYLALSPKSNSAYNAINKAMQIINENGSQNVPIHLRNENSHLYKYPHDYKNHYVKQWYMENKIKLYNHCDNKIENAFYKANLEIKGENND